MKTVNILGTEYKIKINNPKEDKKLEDLLGYCDWSSKEIVIADVNYYNGEKDAMKHLERLFKKVIRHEITHAFLFESGLNEASTTANAWAMNEEMIDWFAYQGPKIYKAWEEADAI